MLNLKEYLGPDGPLSKAIPHYTARDQQIAFAEQVERALENDSTLIVEAGTGTGKTLAYLVPSLLSGKKCLISTGTKNLQDQLFHRDLPTTRDALGVPAVISLLKGRGNYLCRYRLEKHAQSARFTSREQALEFQKIQDWARFTTNGDIAELNSLSEDAPVWSLATSSADSCLGSDCDHFSNCCVNDARAQAQKADIVVINHHLFFADLALREEGAGELLPGCDAMIFDEAHQLPEVGLQFFGTVISARQIMELLNDGISEVESDALESKELIEKNHQLVMDLLVKIHLRLGDTTRAAWTEVEADESLIANLNRLVSQLEVVQDLYETLGERSKGLSNISDRAASAKERLMAFLKKDESTIHWYESRKSNFLLHKTPLEISQPFQEHTQRFYQAMIFTSATLSTGSRFDFFAKRLGLENAETAQFPSPFDYEHRCLLYLPRNLPSPNSSEYIQLVIDCAIPVIETCGGRTFFLFTSHSALSLAARILAEKIDYPLLIQGTISKRRLIERFRELGNAVLLGTASFWEGVDVKGDSLSCVIIDKLPFASPGDPITSARIDDIKRRGGEPFMSYQLPNAIIALRQGVGRLIRDEQDRGVLMICDPRILSKNYGKMFLRSLPRMPITQELAEIERFMQSEETMT